MKTKTIELYDFNELNQEAKDKALSKHNEYNDYPFLEEELSEYLSELLKEANINGDGKLNYSLSYCQGDGVCFSGNFEYKNVNFNIEHNGNYYHKNSVTIEAEEHDDNGDELRDDVLEVMKAEFTDAYKEICDKIEKRGYLAIEYEQSEENFKEMCEANEYTFRENGEMENF